MSSGYCSSLEYERLIPIDFISQDKHNEKASIAAVLNMALWTFSAAI